MEKIKRAFYSETAMKMINILFLLVAILRVRGLIIAAYVIWIVYLACGIKMSSSKGVKISFSVFIVFAIVMIALNIYMYFA